MTNQQQDFADRYIYHKNARKAAQEAGYSPHTAGEQGRALLRHPEIKEYLNKAFTERTMGAKEVLDRLNDIASLDLSEIIDSRGNLDVVKMKELGIDRFVRSIGRDSNGELKIDFMDPMTALMAIGKAHKMFGDANTLSGPGGGGVPVDMRIQFVRPSDTPAVVGAVEVSEIGPGMPAIEPAEAVGDREGVYRTP